MKKHLLFTILACCLLFFGIKSASAATTYTNFTTPGSNGLTAGTAGTLNAGATQTNLIVYGVAIKNTTATTAYTSMRFDLTSGNNWNADFSGNVTLYVMTAAQYAAAGNSFSTATATAMEAIAAPATATLNFNALTGSPAFAANATYYYFITINYTTAPTPSQITDQIELDQTKGPANTTVTTAVGATYTLNPGITFTAASTVGLAANPLSASFTGGAIFGVTMTNSSATSFPFVDFDFSTNGGYAPNTYFTNFKLYVNTTGNTFAGATQITGATFGGTNSQFDMYLTFTSTIPANTSYSYFIVADYTYPSPTTARTFQLSLDDAEPASGVDYTQGLSLLSTNYNIPIPTPVTATAASLTTAAGSNGLSTPATIAAAGNYIVYGMSLTPSATGVTKTLTGLTFTTTTGNFNNYFYGTAYLYASSNSSYDGTAIQISTVTTAGNNTLAFTGFTTAQNVTAGATKYYYVVIVYSTGVAATATQTITYSSATSTATIATGSPVAGPAYTYNPLPVVTATAASLTTTPGSNGLYTSATISSPGSYAIYGMSLTPSATGVSKPLTALSFTVASTQNDNYFYATAYLYASNSSTFSTGTATQISSVATGGNTTLTFTGFTTAQNITAGGAPVYYYVYITYAVPGVAASASQAISYSSATTAATVTPATGVVGPAYIFNPIPYVTATVASLTTADGMYGLATSPIGLAGNYAIYGMSVTPSATGVSTTLTGLTFTATSTQNNNYFYATAYLYSSANSSYDGTAVKISTVTTGASKTLAFTGFTTTQTLTAGAAPIYYYIVIVYAAPGAAASNTSTLAYTSATSAATITPTTGMVTGPTYTFNPTPAVTATDVPAADLTNTAIYVGETNIAVAGIELQMNIGTTTLTKLIFSFNPTATATIAKYFTASSVKLVSSTSPLTSPFNYSGTTLVVGSAGIVTSTGVFTVTVPSAAISITPTYFYLVADYTVTGGATPQTFNFAPTGYTTALSGAVTTGYGTYPFTCTTPTYYWTGTAGDNNWTTANNWEVTTTAPIIINGYYPGQIYAGNTASTQDNADVSPSVTTPTINLASNITIANLTFEAGVATTLNVNGSAIKLNVSNQLNLGSTTSGAVASSLTLGGAGILDINNDAEINYSATLNVPANGNLTIDNGVDVDFNGAAGQVAKINLTGGLIQCNGGNFEFNGASAVLSATAGTLNAVNNTDFDLNAANNQVINNGATINVSDSGDFTFNVGSDNVTNTSGTFNITNTSFNAFNGTVVVNGGTMNVNSDAGGGSDVELGEIVYFFGFPIGATNGTMTVSTGGTLNVSGVSLIHTAWNASTLTNNGGLINVTTGSTIFADYAAYNNTSGTANINASTVELAVGGTSLTNGGTMNFSAASFINYTYQNSVLSNTGTINTANTTINFNSTGCSLSNTAGSFNFGAGSVMNLANSKDAVTNSGSGTFTCGPTSIMNLTYSTTTVANAATVTNTSSNPFTLLSDATGSATIGKIATIGTNGSFIGQFNVQRYISTASRNYRLLAAPVNQTSPKSGTAGSPDLVDISDLGQSVTSPATYNGAFIGGPGAGFTNYVANPLLYLYQESILPGTTENSTFTSGKNVGVTGISVGSPFLVTTQSTAAGGTTASDNSTTVKIPAGNAYLLYYIHDNTSTSVTSPLTTATTTASGYINQGAIPFVLWGSGTLTTAMTYSTGTGALYPGVTMVGNPYASTIDLKQVYTDNAIAANIFTSGTGEAFYELDPSTEQFVSYNYNGSTVITSGSDASEYIASGQGFYVTVLSTKAGKIFNFAEDQKTTSTTTPVFPVLTLEGIRSGTGTTVDNVSLHNKTTDAVLATGNVNTNTSAPVNKSTSDANRLSKVNHKASLTLASNGAQVRDTVKGSSGKQYNNTPPVDTTKTPTPPTPPKIAGLHLKLVMNSLTYDECGVYFNSQWSDKVDNNDARDLDGTGGQVYLSSYSSDDVRTSINAMSDYRVVGKRVKLFVKFSAAGIYQVQLNDLQNFDEDNYSVFVIDNMLKDSLDLTLYKSYNFNYAPGTANDSTRFVLAIEHKPVPQYALLTFAGQKITQGVQLNWTVKNESNTTKFVVQKLGANNTYAFLDSLQSDSVGNYSLVDQHPSLGSNTYRLQQTTVLGVITYSAPVTIGYNSTSPNGGLNIYPNPAKTQITVTLSTSSLATQVATVDIYNTSGTLIEHKAVNSNSFTHDVSSYQLGVYIIELKNSNGLLVGKSKFVKVQ